MKSMEIIFVLIAAILTGLVSYKWNTLKILGKSALIFIILSAIFIAINSLHQTRKEFLYAKVFVVPSSYVIHPGMNEEFIMTVTNNNDYPLYKVQVKINIENGDLPLEDIFISPKSGERLPDKLNIEADDKLYKGPPKDVARLQFYNDNGQIKVTAMDVRTKEGEIYSIFFIDHMSANTSKDFHIKINKTRCEKESKISFKIRGSSKNPVPTYFNPGETKIVIPKEGHH